MVWQRAPYPHNNKLAWMLLKEKIWGPRVSWPGSGQDELLMQVDRKSHGTCESNLQVMLIYRLVRFKPKKWQSRGVSLDWITNCQHQWFLRSKIWGYISRVWKIMIKEVYRILPRTRMKVLNWNIWWTEGVELLRLLWSSGGRPWPENQNRCWYKIGPPSFQSS